MVDCDKAGQRVWSNSLTCSGCDPRRISTTPTKPFDSHEVETAVVGVKSIDPHDIPSVAVRSDIESCHAPPRRLTPYNVFAGDVTDTSVLHEGGNCAEPLPEGASLSQGGLVGGREDNPIFPTVISANNFSPIDLKEENENGVVSISGGIASGNEEGFRNIIYAVDEIQNETNRIPPAGQQLFHEVIHDDGRIGGDGQRHHDPEWYHRWHLLVALGGLVATIVIPIVVVVAFRSWKNSS